MMFIGVYIGNGCQRVSQELSNHSSSVSKNNLLEDCVVDFHSTLMTEVRKSHVPDLCIIWQSRHVVNQLASSHDEHVADAHGNF